MPLRISSEIEWLDDGLGQSQSSRTLDAISLLAARVISVFVLFAVLFCLHLVSEET